MIFSARTALRGFAFALSFPAKLLHAIPTSRSTDSEADEEGADAVLGRHERPQTEPPERIYPEPEGEVALDRFEDTAFSGPELEDESVAAEANMNGEPWPEEEEPAAAAPADEPAPAPGAGATLESPMKIRFVRIRDTARLPTRAHEGDAGLDLYAAEGARIGPGQRVSVGTGLVAELPDGWAGLVVPRSGLALKHGIALVNSPGLIDPTYRGEIRVLLLNTDSSAPFKVAPGDRIAQLLLTPFSSAPVVEVDEIGVTTIRGSGGFGSSGA